MTFVFAAALATLVVLVVALSNLTPVSRTQIFFLTTTPTDTMEITVTPFSPNDSNLPIFTEAFIREYIKLRNEIIPNVGLMRRKWESGSGIVYLTSSPEVWGPFTRTAAFGYIMGNYPELDLVCRVEFMGAIEPWAKNRYITNFRYICTDNAGQRTQKDFTILIGIDFEKRMQWGQRLDNPLGIFVTEYEIRAGGGDPLNFVQ